MRRFLADTIDVLCAVVLTLLLSSSLGVWCAERAVTLLRIGEPDGFWRGPIPLVLGVAGNLVYAFPLLCAVVWLPEAVSGRGLGKSLLGMRVRSLEGARTAWLQRFLLKCTPSLVWAMALLLPHTGFAIAFVVAFLAWTASILPWLFGSATLYDRWLGTRVDREVVSDAAV